MNKRIRMLAAGILSPRRGPRELLEHIEVLLRAYTYSKERGYRLYMAVFNLRIKWDMFLLYLHVDDRIEDEEQDIQRP